VRQACARGPHVARLSSRTVNCVRIEVLTLTNTTFQMYVSISKISWSVLFKEIILVYSENHTKRVITLYGKYSFITTLKQVACALSTVF